MRMRCGPCCAVPRRAPRAAGPPQGRGAGRGLLPRCPRPPRYSRSAPRRAGLGGSRSGAAGSAAPSAPRGQRRGRAGSGDWGAGSGDGGRPLFPGACAQRGRRPQPLRSPDRRGAGSALSEPPRPALPCPALRRPRPVPGGSGGRRPFPSLPFPPSPPAVPPPPRSRTPRAVRCGEPGSTAAPAVFLARRM